MGVCVQCPRCLHPHAPTWTPHTLRRKQRQKHGQKQPTSKALTLCFYPPPTSASRPTLVRNKPAFGLDLVAVSVRFDRRPSVLTCSIGTIIGCKAVLTILWYVSSVRRSLFDTHLWIAGRILLSLVVVGKKSSHCQVIPRVSIRTQHPDPTRQSVQSRRTGEKGKV